jgi:hypothetical protein
MQYRIAGPGYRRRLRRRCAPAAILTPAACGPARRTGEGRQRPCRTRLQKRNRAATPGCAAARVASQAPVANIARGVAAAPRDAAGIHSPAPERKGPWRNRPGAAEKIIAAPGRPGPGLQRLRGGICPLRIPVMTRVKTRQDTIRSLADTTGTGPAACGPGRATGTGAPGKAVLQVSRAPRHDRRFPPDDIARHDAPFGRGADGETTRKTRRNESCEAESADRQGCAKAEQHRRRSKAQTAIASTFRRVLKMHPSACRAGRPSRSGEKGLPFRADPEIQCICPPGRAPAGGRWPRPDRRGPGEQFPALQPAVHAAATSSQHSVGRS